MKTLLIGCWLAALVCLTVLAKEMENGVYAAHEWGTFTSVQGADGVQLAGRTTTIRACGSGVSSRCHRGGWVVLPEGAAPFVP